MPMYKLPALFPSDFDVHPKNIVYHVASYHGFLGDSQPAETLETDPVKVLEQKQLSLIEQLKRQADSLGKLLASSKPVAAQPKTTSKAPAPTTSQEAPKKDKDAKKEARKAAKAEAKTKVAGGDVPAAKKPTPTGTLWTVKDDRRSWEFGLSLTANISSVLANYPQEPLGQVTLTVTKADLVWVESLALVGQKRSVAFTGSVTNNASKDAKTTVNVKIENQVRLTVGKTTIHSRPTVWKSLGLALGLVSRAPEQVLTFAHQSLWFNKADKVLLKSADLSLLEREASQFLARYDCLSSQWDITAADIILKSLFNATSSHANNVEIWSKKIDILLL